ncbi:MAG: hypothetical protein WD847_21880 [Pirellulales bacterium]
MDPVVCDSCGSRFSVKDLTEDHYGALDDQHYYQEFAEELRMLLKVKQFYRRHPEAEGRIRPHFQRVLESDDPEVMESLCAGRPLDEIELPPEELPLALAEDEAEVVEYLRHNGFSLGPRMRFVSEEVARLAGCVRFVACPRCEMGRLHVPPENWDEFSARNEITWFRPHWHSFDSDGALHVRTSGWEGDSHWTGKTTITPDAPDYAFWCWLVAQERFHRLVNVDELPALREEWSRIADRGR